MKKTILTALALLLAAGGLFAQTKAETSLYTKTLKKPSVKAYEKFLAKFPDSTYSPEILTLRDSTLFAAVDPDDAEAVEAFAAAHPDSPIAGRVAAVVERHNTSPLSQEEATRIFSSLVPDGAGATGWRRTGRDFIIGISLRECAPVLTRCVKGADGQWSVEQTRALERYVIDPSLGGLSLAESPEVVPMNGRRLIAFSYLNGTAAGANGTAISGIAAGANGTAATGANGAGSGKAAGANGAAASKAVEQVLCLYDWEADNLTVAMFYGRALSTASDGLPQIEGQCPESAMAGGLMLPEMMYLLNRIGSDSHFVPIARADALTDDSIEWWLTKNPTAQTKASKINFGALDAGSSLVEGFKNCRSRDKDSSKKFTAALFNIRDYTVIVAYSKTYGDYLLVWCEPVCVNKNRDQLLNTIYFEDDNTLDLFYYKGKTTFKYRINLASKAIRR